MLEDLGSKAASITSLLSNLEQFSLYFRVFVPNVQKGEGVN